MTDKVTLELTPRQMRQLKACVIQSRGFDKVCFKDEADMSDAELSFSEMAEAVIKVAAE